MCVTICSVGVALGAAPAWAGSSGQGGAGGSLPVMTGIDVSYPQCGDSLPGAEAFAIVGVNGGLANDYNPCLAAQFGYARTLPGGTTQPVAQTYLNTADPGNSVADWPSPAHLGAYGNASTPVGACDYASGTSGPGANSLGCSYIYGYDMVRGITTPAESIEGDAPYFTRVTGAALAATPVWLDVETANSWQAGGQGQGMNIADLQGMVDALHAVGSAPLGIYSTAYQWNQITGTPTGAAAGELAGMPVWIPGATNESDAQANCSQTAYTAGTVVLTQWFGSPYDQDISCTASTGGGTAAATLSFPPSSPSLTAGQPSGAMQVSISSAPSGDLTVALGSSSAAGTFAASPSGSWSATGSVTIAAGSTTSGDFYYEDTAAGSPTLTASASGVTSATQTETVTAGVLASISVTPGSASVPAGGTQVFTAAGADAYGNPVPVDPDWTATSGLLSSTTGQTVTYTAADSSATVTAAQGGVTGTASVTVTAASTPAAITAASSCTRAMCSFSGTGGSTNTTLAWDFGTGGVTYDTNTGAAVTFTYGSPGSYVVTLTADNGTTDTRTVSCTWLGHGKKSGLDCST